MSRRAETPGFTLVEVCVALAILGLIGLVLLDLLETSAAAWERMFHGARPPGSDALAGEFLAERLAAALPRDPTHGANPAQPTFQGGPGGVSFLAPAPDSLGGGLARYRLELARRPDETLALRVSVAPLRGLRDPPAPGVAFDRLADARLDYYGRADGSKEPGWSESWANPDRLPRLVRLQLHFPPPPRPPLVLIVALHMDGDFACLYGSLAKDCPGN